MAHLLFLSYAGADAERALRLAAAIEASPDAQNHGLKVWVDKRPDGANRLHAGTPWQDQLERAIAADSTAFGLLLTREGARNWVRLEVRVALDRVIAEQRQGGLYPFVPIIADDPGDIAQLPPFAQQYQGVRLTENGHGLADLVRVAARLDAAQSVRLVAQPFMGLEAFEAKDAALFFGRRKETQDLVDRLRTTNLVLVTGDSGSGKSSLVKAGLIPAFREGALADPLGRRPEPGQWHVIAMRPGTDPFEGLVEGTQRAATAAGIAPEMIFALGTAIRTRDPGSIRDALRQSGPPDASLLLVVDQFEELWTLTTDDTKRRDFLAALLALVPEGDLARRVVGSMRRDYYHLHTDDERLFDRLAANGNAGRFLLGAMAPESLRDVVEKPLLLAGESETRAAALADEVVKDVAGEPGNLALVEMALHESWERRHASGGDLALAYQRLDRLEGALARAAEEVFWNPTHDPKKLTEPERPIAEALFMRLVRAGDTGGATRRPVEFVELEEPARVVARKLATRECRRLLVVREPDGGSGGEDAITVELAHEQLVTQWPDYRFWLRGTGTGRHEPEPSRAADKRALDRLVDATRNWDSRRRQEEDLARGGELTEFGWLHTASFRDPWLSPLEREFIARSLAARKAEELEQQRQLETLRRLAATRRRQAWGAALAALLLLLVAGFASWQWREADLAKVEAEANARLADAQLTEAKRIDSRRLANLSLQATESGDAVTGILLAMEALPNRFENPDRPIVDDVWPALRAAVAQQQEMLVLRGHEGGVRSVAFSPDGTRIVTGSGDGTAKIWHADGSGVPLTLPYQGHVTSVAFSPDGAQVVAASQYDMARVWHADGSGEPLLLRPPHEIGVSSAAFSPDGTRIATGEMDAMARVWHADGSGEPLVLRGHESGVRSVAFSPDGTRIVTGSGDGTARVWRANGSGEPLVLRGHEGGVQSVAFSPDGTRIVAGSGDGTARVWRADGSGEPLVLRGHEGGVQSVAFSPDGMRILTGSDDRTARVWRADGSGESLVLRGHEDLVTSVAYSPDGTRILTGSIDRTARVWHADSNGAPLILHGHENLVTSVAYSPDGARIVSGSDDRTARVWRADGSGEPLVLRGHEGGVRSVAFSPDGIRIVTGSIDETARVWRADGGGVSEILRGPTARRARGVMDVLRGIEDGVGSVAFSPDGARIVMAFSDGARLWRADGSGTPKVLGGVDGAAISSAAFSQDGTRIVMSYSEAEVWRADFSGKLLDLRGHEGWVNSAAFSPDGTRIVAGTSDKTVLVWRADGSGKPLVLRGHEGQVRSVAFSQDGTRIVSGSEDKTVRVWRTDGAGEPLVLRGHEGEVLSVAFSPDGTRVVSGGDNTVRVWPLVGLLEQVATHARSLKLPRQLTEAQKREYLIVDDW